jgi:glycerol kinase
VRPVVTETTALGAAYLAGLATGLWESQDQVAALWRVERRFEPALGVDERSARLHQWQRAVERSRQWSE